MDSTRLYSRARTLAIITILYNILEGIVSVYLGIKDETVSLFGFGLDSFVEVISGVGIYHMVIRASKSHGTNVDSFERTALRITGFAFYMLSAGLLLTSIYNLYTFHKPQTTLWGMVVAAISILTMWLLIREKIKTGNALNSQAILADAQCTRACMYLSYALLISSAGYELTGIGGIDSIGGLYISWFSFKEGREAFAKSRGNACSCGGACKGG